MKIDEFLNSMSQADMGGLMDIANQVTANVNLELIETLLSLSSYAWLWTGGPSVD
jgi:hypothetical protein